MSLCFMLPRSVRSFGTTNTVYLTQDLLGPELPKFGGGGPPFFSFNLKSVQLVSCCCESTSETSNAI